MLRKLALVFFLALLFAGYYWGQNVGNTPAVLARALERLLLAGLDSAIVVLLIIMGGAMGRKALAGLAWASLTRAERISLEVAFGWGVLSVVLLGMGAVGMFEVFYFMLLGLVLFIMFVRDSWAWARDARHVLGRVLATESAWERFLLLTLVLWLGTSALVALAPPFKWDAMTYHLVAPARYLQEHAIRTHPDNFFLGFPQATEMLFSLPMSLERDHAPALLHWGAGVLGLLLVAGALYRHSHRATALLASVFLVLGASTWRLFSTPYVDLFMVLYGAGALVSVHEWRTTGKNSWLMLAGALCGMAMGVKYTGAILSVAVALVVLVHRPRAVWRNSAVLVGCAVLAFGAWGMKGAILYSNPFYPYVFGGVAWDSLRNATFNMAGEGFLATPAYLWHLPLLPFTATLFGVEQAAPYSYSVGIWLLTAPFLLVWGWRTLSPEARALAQTASIVAGVFWGAWVFLAATNGIGAQPRLLLAGAPAVMVMGGLALYGIAKLPKRPLNVFFIVQAMIVLSILVAGILLAHTFTRGGAARYLVGNVSQNEYLGRNLGVYHDAMRQLGTLPRGTRVLFLWEPMSYYCPPHVRCVGDVLHDHWEHALQTGNTPAQTFAQWREAGFDYVLVNGLDGRADVGYGFWLKIRASTAPYNAQFPPALAEVMTQVWTDDITYRLYTWQE